MLRPSVGFFRHENIQPVGNLTTKTYFSIMQHDDLTAKIQDYKTDENELEELIEQYDLDATLEAQFNSLDKRFKQLEIKYQSLLNARRFLING